MRLDRLLTVDDFKRVAERRVPKMFFQYADSGAYTEQSYRENSSDSTHIRLEQRVGRDISSRSLSTTMLGQPVSLPLGLAPTGAAGMQVADGEIKAARAAAEAGIPFTLSTVSICSIEDVAAATDRPFWFQLYVRKDRAFTERLIDRARAANCAALVVTMDCQHYGQRHKDVRNGLTVPLKFTPKFVAELALKPAWSLAMLGTPRRSFGNFAGHVPGANSVAELAQWMSQQDDLTLNWQDLIWIKRRFGGPVIANELMSTADGERFLATGIADALSFGRDYIATPDLVERVARGAAFNAQNPSTFYGEGPEGYTDYPFLDA